MNEVWALEVKTKDEPWSPIEVHMDKKEAQRERRSWKRAAPWDSWRVKRYVPDGDCDAGK